MNNISNRILANISSIFGMLVFITLFVIGIFIFSYLLIIAAIIGLVLFIIIFIRVKWLQHRMKKRSGNNDPLSSGRIIDHDNPNNDQQP